MEKYVIVSLIMGLFTWVANAVKMSRRYPSFVMKVFKDPICIIGILIGYIGNVILWPIMILNIGISIIRE